MERQGTGQQRSQERATIQATPDRHVLHALTFLDWEFGSVQNGANKPNVLHFASSQFSLGSAYVALDYFSALETIDPDCVRARARSLRG